MGKATGGAGRAGYQFLNANGGRVGTVLMNPGQPLSTARNVAINRSLLMGATNVQKVRENEQGQIIPIGRPQRVRVKITGSGNVRPSQVGVHTFDFGNITRAYSRSSYSDARRRAIADAAVEGKQTIRYVGTR